MPDPSVPTNHEAREHPGPDPLRALARFAVEGEPTRSEPLRVGLIHESHVVTCRTPRGPRRYLLQRLNTAVFAAPGPVMENVLRVTRHLQGRQAAAGVPDPGRRVLTVVPSREGPPWHVDDAGGWWRAYVFIEGATSFDHPLTPTAAERAAATFGRFVADLSDLPGPRLHETLPGFHDTPARYRALLTAADADPLGRAAAVRAELAALEARREMLGALHEAAARGLVPERVVHNDTKLNNVLFDTGTGEALCVVDLDTVMPGLALHDYGDLVRSAASEAPEDARDLRAVRVSPALHRAVTRGWLAPLAPLLTTAEAELLPLAPRVVTLELAARFLTDHLLGDRYFRTGYPGHNLDRCRAQLALAADMERQEGTLDASVREALGG